jgi:hypothetical protein
MSEQTPESVDLNVDEEKMEAWDEVKSDYEVEPGGKPTPNVMDEAETSTAETEAHEASGEDSREDSSGGDG